MNRKPSRRSWRGGHIHRTANGLDLYIIERQIRGKRYHVSTHAHDLEAAIEQLARFEANPDGYQPTGELAEALLLDDSLAEEFFVYLTKTKGNTVKYSRDVAYCLGDLAKDLGEGADLRKLTVRQLKEAVARREGQKRRIIAVKSFFSWLRKERCLIDRATDPTLDLVVPAAQPEQWKRRKAVPLADLQAVAPKLATPYRDVLIFMAELGWHITEMERFARHAEGSEFFRVENDPKGVLAVVRVRHKSRRPVANALVDPGVVDAAERIWNSRGVPRHLNAALRKACLAAKVPVFTFGVLRHSVATWGKAFGRTDQEMADHLHHLSASTTRRHYIHEEIPVPVNLPRLGLAARARPRVLRRRNA